MQITILFITTLISILAIFEDRIKPMKPKFYTFILVLLWITALCFGAIEIYSNNIESKRLKKASNSMLSEACDQIRGAIYGYEVDKKSLGDSIAAIIANRSIAIAGNSITRIISMPRIKFADNELMAANKLIFITMYQQECCSKNYRIEIDSLINVIDKSAKSNIPTSEIGN
jgi:maltodextrin utilization protein YvdJ